MSVAKPARLPARPHFSSGPCAKRPGWSLEALSGAWLGRSHRARGGAGKLAEVIARSRVVLGLPDSHRLAIVPGSDTGAVELALWSLLGSRAVEMLAWESFGQEWVADVTKQLKLEDVRVREADYGALPDLSAVDWTRDVVFAWNGTTSGVRVPDGAWIPEDREGLAICDATSAAFAMDLPWDKLDVVTWSWQKVLGGEGAHGMLALSPRAVARLEAGPAPRPLPKLFRLTKGGRLNETIFEGQTINTPSMLCAEDALDGLIWAEAIGGLQGLMARSRANADVLQGWVDRTPWVANLAQDAATRSTTSVCLKLVDTPADPGRMARLLEEEGAAFDIGGYRNAPPGLRIWCGATVETGDIEALLPWLDWAHDVAAREAEKAS
ncbi:MAG: phosphoserine transaminase [Proteobacteria bacterium]|nr:phosphoserine transaminase [Pseudomonadota bacterium]